MTEAAKTDLEIDAFYLELTSRNRGFVPVAQQQLLARACVLVAGCGSTGGAAVEPLTRLGVQRFVLADNGEFELNNLNRQHASLADIGRNKAETAADRVRAINPHAQLEVDVRGITDENVDYYVGRCDVVIDGVDVTEMSGWRAKLRLHQSAAAARKPVLSGYDMAGVQYVRFYDYRSGVRQPLDGKVTDSDLDTLDIPAIMLRVMPVRFAPVELMKELRANLNTPDYHIPQLVYAAVTFGALSARLVAEILAGNAVRRHTCIDVHDVVRTRRAKAGVRLSRAAFLVRSIPHVIRFSTPGTHRPLGEDDDNRAAAIPSVGGGPTAAA